MKLEMSSGIVNVALTHSDDHFGESESKMSRRRHRTPFFSIVVGQAQDLLLPQLQSSAYACPAVSFQRQQYCIREGEVKQYGIVIHIEEVAECIMAITGDESR
jgi:hypothetical protein